MAFEGSSPLLSSTSSPAIASPPAFEDQVASSLPNELVQNIFGRVNFQNQPVARRLDQKEVLNAMRGERRVEDLPLKEFYETFRLAISRQDPYLLQQFSANEKYFSNLDPKQLKHLLLLALEKRDYTTFTLIWRVEKLDAHRGEIIRSISNEKWYDIVTHAAYRAGQDTAVEGSWDRHLFDLLMDNEAVLRHMSSDILKDLVNYQRSGYPMRRIFTNPILIPKLSFVILNNALAISAHNGYWDLIKIISENETLRNRADKHTLENALKKFEKSKVGT